MKINGIKGDINLRKDMIIRNENWTSLFDHVVITMNILSQLKNPMIK